MKFKATLIGFAAILMENQGFIERRVELSDRRAKQIYMTVRRAVKVVSKAITTIMAKMPR